MAIAFPSRAPARLPSAGPEEEEAPPLSGGGRHETNEGMKHGFTIELDGISEDFTDCKTGECRVNVLPMLYQISQILAASEDLAHSLAIILKVMQDRMKVVRGMVSLFDRESGQIFIHDSFGLSEEQKARGIYSLGEGVTGRVVESAKAIVIPRLRDDPSFLNRTHSRSGGADMNSSFFCVPILHSRKVLGTISAERIYDNRRLLKQDVELMATVALMIAPAVELFLMENIDQVRLENENRRLQNALKERFKPTNIIGNSKPMLEVYELIQKIAATKTTVLVLGESGVGKELVANAIHYNSASSEGPFIKFNCAALPESIVRKRVVRP